MNIEAYVSHFVTLSLLVLSAVYKSPFFAYASVLGLGLIAYKQIMQEKIAALKPPAVSDEMKRTVQDMNARLVTIEHGIRIRGF